MKNQERFTLQKSEKRRGKMKELSGVALQASKAHSKKLTQKLGEMRVNVNAAKVFYSSEISFE